MAYITLDLYDDADQYDTSDFYDGPLFDPVITVTEASRWLVQLYDNDLPVTGHKL